MKESEERTAFEYWIRNDPNIDGNFNESLKETKGDSYKDETLSFLFTGFYVGYNFKKRR
jgi:hypothetical protein